jgi:hypothetical protein
MRSKRWLLALLASACLLPLSARPLRADPITVCTYMGSGRDAYGQKYNTYWCEMWDGGEFMGAWTWSVPSR